MDGEAQAKLTLTVFGSSYSVYSELKTHLNRFTGTHQQTNLTNLHLKHYSTYQSRGLRGKVVAMTINVVTELNTSVASVSLAHHLPQSARSDTRFDWIFVGVTSLNKDIWTKQ